MKSSNILLIIILSLLFTAVVASDLILKDTFEKLDKSDRFVGYSKNKIEAFHYVKLKGKGFGLTEIANGKEFEIKSAVDKKNLDWKVKNDTLTIEYKSVWSDGNDNPSYLLYAKPSILVTAPDLRGVVSENVFCKIQGYQTKALHIDQKGKGILLDNNQIQSINAQFGTGTWAKISNTNAFSSAQLVVKDSSSLHVEKDVFEKLNLQIEDRAVIDLPGSLLKKL